jgi:NADPH:quinone reductase-like Zn-dependent oxidoreductase
MKAFVLRTYGSADHLELTDVPTPVPATNEVLVRVRATSVNPYDWHLMRGEPRVARLMPGIVGLRGPKVRILGADMAGQVEAVGQGVTGFRPGDDVYALLPGGGFGEYVCVAESQLAPMPANLSYEQVAAVPMGAITALVALREAGKVQSGQRVLINGASGGVGTFAVQLARAYGATVTGVCSTRNVELVRSIGAHDVVDYTREDFTEPPGRFHLLLDIAGGRSVREGRRALVRKGTYVAVGGPAGRWLQPAGHVFAAAAAGPFVSQRMVLADVSRYPDHAGQLRSLTEFLADGRVVPVIGRRYSFDDIPAAVRYQEQGHAPGKVVVTL